MDERANLGRRDDPVDNEARLYVSGPGESYDDDLAASAPAAPPEGDQQPEELRGDIEETRAEMSETIDAIQERLSPPRLMEQAKDSVREATIGKAERMASNVGDTARDAGSSMSETIKQNPVPAALVAFGVGWLWMRRKSPSGGSRRDYRSGGRDYAPRYAYDYRSGSYDPYGPYGPAQRWDEPGRTERPSTGGIGQTASQLQDRAGQVAGQVQEQAGQMVSQTQEQVGQWSDQAQQQVSQWGGQAQDQFQQLRSRFDRLLQENPLAVAAVTLGLGAAVGLMVPETEQENQWLGDTRDQVVDKAQASAQDKLQQVQQVAQKAKESAQDTIQQEAKKQGLTS